MLKRLIPAFAILLGWTSLAWGAEPLATMTSLRQVHALTNGEGSKGYPVDFEATVTFFREDEHILFVQDSDIGIFVVTPDVSILVPGDRVRIRGNTAGSYKPLIVNSIITLLKHGLLPNPVTATHEQLVKGQFDCRLVTVRGIVQSADPEARQSWMRNAITGIQFRTESGPVTVYVETADLQTLRNLLDATVEITGVSGGIFDDKMQLTGTALYVPSLAYIKIHARPVGSPWLLQVTPLDKILSVYNMHDLTPRVRVQGTITYYQPGHAIVLQDGLKSLWIETMTNEPLRIGDRADATGFTDAHDRFMSLINAEVHDSHVYAPVTPQPATWQQLAQWSNNQADGHQNDLVSIEGKVVTVVREATQDEFVVKSNGGLFTAIFYHLPEISALPPMKNIPLETRIRVTGICTRTDTKSAVPGKDVPFNILLRSFDDIAVVAGPPMLNIRNMIIIVCLLLLVVACAGVWGWNLERKLHSQTVAMSVLAEAEAELERLRSHILEDINGSRPLGEVLEKIAEMVSSMLKNSPCWCELTDGVIYGNALQGNHNLRIVSANVHVRSGPALGALFAAINPATETNDSEALALNNGTRLAALAIETRRLYSDLRRRSEFDLLTDIHNRFSLDKQLDILIEESRPDGRVFGLIYIDLDQFKPINDRYGHHVGDLFLQEVAVRMKRQLRGGDMLARLGGDEFAALVSEVNNRADVEEAALRLEHCFDDPFAVEGHILQGAASFGIALYPEDGTTNDSLLTAADAAMYAVKNKKHQTMN